MSIKVDPAIVDGIVEIPADAFLPKNTRVRISIMIPGDVLDALRKLGKARNKGYQTVANDLLRSVLLEGRPSDPGEQWLLIKELRAMNAKMEVVEERLALTEQALKTFHATQAAARKKKAR